MVLHRILSILLSFVYDIRLFYISFYIWQYLPLLKVTVKNSVELSLHLNICMFPLDLLLHFWIFLGPSVVQLQPHEHIISRSWESSMKNVVVVVQLQNVAVILFYVMCNLYYIHRAHNLIHSSLIPPHYIYIFIYLYMYLLCWKFCFKADNTETMCALFKTAWQHLTWDQLIVCSWVQT